MPKSSISEVEARNLRIKQLEEERQKTAKLKELEEQQKEAKDKAKEEERKKT